MDFSKLTNVLSLAKMASKLVPAVKTEMEAVEKRLTTKRVVGIAGAGLAKIVLDGNGQCVGVDLDASILAKKQVADDLVRTAVNDAFSKLATETEAEREAMMKGLLGQLGGMSAFMMGGMGGGKGPKLQ